MRAREIPNARPDVSRQRVFGQPPKCADDGFRGVPYGAGVPDREGRDPAGVDVLGGLDQLGEARQGVTRLRVQRIVHLHQDRVVALNDERVFGMELGHVAYVYESLRDSNQPISVQ